MPAVQPIGVPSLLGREQFTLALPDFRSWPEGVDLHSQHFVAFVAADSTQTDAEELAAFCRRLLDAGCVYLCAWGPGCERLHDLFDLVCYEITPVIMTTWHADESLDDALWFFTFLSFPDDAYADATQSTLAISIGNPEWQEHIRNRLTNPDSLREIATE